MVSKSQHVVSAVTRHQTAIAIAPKRTSKGVADVESQARFRGKKRK